MGNGISGIKPPNCGSGIISAVYIAVIFRTVFPTLRYPPSPCQGSGPLSWVTLQLGCLKLMGRFVLLLELGVRFKAHKIDGEGLELGVWGIFVCLFCFFPELPQGT